MDHGPCGRPTTRPSGCEAELQELQGEVVKLKSRRRRTSGSRACSIYSDKGTYPEGTEFVVARVIGKSPTRWEAWVQIDKGSADGIEVDQPVVGATPMAGESLSGKGLVGKVIGVTPTRPKCSSSPTPNPA